VGRSRGQVRPDIANQYGFAVDRILSEKLAASILEFPDLRRIQLANLAVGPTPQARERGAEPVIRLAIHLDSLARRSLRVMCTSSLLNHVLFDRHKETAVAEAKSQGEWKNDPVNGLASKRDK
jgi:hypothetical protein